MPITTGTYKCPTCKAEFKAKSDKMYPCPCGASAIQPDIFFHSYTGDACPEKISQETLYVAEEYIPLTEEAARLYDEIKAIYHATGYKYHLYEQSDTNPDGTSFLSDININIRTHQSKYTSGENEISLHINLVKTNWSGHDNTSEGVQRRLETFLGIMQDVESGAIDVQKNSMLDAMADRHNLRVSETQVEEYDYKYHV